ncbi:MAG: amino acid ABC transporter substrate-binding protein, partial [Candidatus Sedimenticola sp. (ex Thyasira tokunagai)]
PVVAQGDDEWFNIVRWSLYAMINAEELGIASYNINNMAMSSDPAIMRFIGLEGVKGRGLGLSNTWARDIIKQVGNYGESFERNLGMESPLKIRRGYNALWNNGGILYAPPIR